jgi:hypothetical protein
VFVLHRANEASGGKVTPVELEDFLRKGNTGPEHQALRQMISMLVDLTLRSAAFGNGPSRGGELGNGA